MTVIPAPHEGKRPDRLDLFDQDTALTPAQRKKLFGRSASKTQKRGYAAPPGTGPENETCKSCAFILRRQMAKTYIKCGLFAKPTFGPATDILASSPACRLWSAPGSPEAKAKGAP